jgi:RNA polymerase sigma-70 factor (ECF subfamily)
MSEPDSAPRRPVEDVRSRGAELDRATAAEFASFYRVTAQELVRFLVLQGAAAADAAEVAQDTLISAYQRWQGIDHPRAWCYRVASRGWIRKMTSIHEDLAADPAAASPLLGATPSEAWHVRHELVVALAALPPRQRQVMAWTLSGYTPAEIATELQLARDAVRASLRLARRALAERLTNEQDPA